MSYLHIQPEIADALAEKRPVLALESTIISHGMPYPENVETALKVEATVRDQGAIPATMAIMDGKLRAGLTADDIERIGKAALNVTKASRRDIPFLLQSRQLGATTVAATMIIAARAGIRIFATGGIGGVHRGADKTFDISADLQELAHTSVAVVCAGAKSILDLPLTLEYLETYGVPVIGYGTDEFPAFYTRKSGIPVNYRLDSPQIVADVLRTKWHVGLEGGVVIANPVPKAYSLDAAYLHDITQQALHAADEARVQGKALTPFLLAKIKELTAGQSLVSNIELVLSNARLAAKIAAAMVS
ncbi:MAG: pseudouridine-5'-phosphate glycosidase [Bacteroidetes bacterium]|nr:MAG: pseudouridine-5'-phosphate glycosidase [Bacteroidota bacterium]